MSQTAGGLYEIWVSEPLDPSWSEWLDDFEITRGEEPVTRICGSVKDQTALYGLLNKIRDLNLTLVCLKKL